MIKNKKKTFIIFTILALLLVGIVSVENSHSAPNAFSACSKMGSYMKRKPAEINALNPDEPNRKWTVEEVFRKATWFTSYNGEGKGNWLYADKVDRGKARVGEDAWNAPGVQERLQEARSLMSCTLGRGDIIPNAILSAAGAVVSLINSMVSLLIGNDVIVEGIADIVGGGGDSGGGLIGTLTNSIYMPLVVIAFVITAATILYKGLIQMKFREALSAIIWSVGAFLVGLALMLNPTMLASAPQKATSTITTCIIGALSGQNCLNDEITTPSLLAGTECRSEIVGGENGIDMIVNSMGCTIWKAFILETWAQQQFGKPYSQLYTYNVPPEGAEWSNLPEGKGEQYCVNLASTESANDVVGEINMDLNSNSTVCNVALYQLYLKTEMNDPINHEDDGYSLTKPDKGKSYDARWYDIIVPMANDSSNWDNWIGDGQFLNRLGTSLFAGFAVTLASFILVSLSIFGAAYKIISVLMMAFAPLFFLLAIEPNRGKKIFLGWLETLFSSILKYFAITLLLVVSLVLYSGVLSNTSGTTAFISVIVLTAALWMYRKEVIDIIGASNLGGQRLSNKFKQKMDGAKRQFKEKGSAFFGGKVGGAVASVRNRNENVANRDKHIEYLKDQLNAASTFEEEDRIRTQIKEEENAKKEEGSKFSALHKGSKEGGRQSLKRSIKRGTSMPANVMRQYDNTKKSMNRENIEKNFKTNNFDEYDNDKDNDDKNNTGASYNSTSPNPLSKEEMTRRAEEIKKERSKMVYDESLSEDEKNSLKDFVDKVEQMTHDDDLIDAGNSKEVLNDNNKKNIVSSEINARLRYNALNNTPNGKLGRHELAKLEYMSDEELKVNLDMYKENYLETGQKEDYDKFKNILNEEIERGTTSKKMSSVLLDEVDEKRKNIEKNNEDYVRNPDVPTLEEFDNDPKKYIEKDLTVPQSIEEMKANGFVPTTILKSQKTNKGKTGTNQSSDKTSGTKKTNGQRTKTSKQSSGGQHTKTSGQAGTKQRTKANEQANGGQRKETNKQAGGQRTRTNGQPNTGQRTRTNKQTNAKQDTRTGGQTRANNQTSSQKRNNNNNNKKYQEDTKRKQDNKANNSNEDDWSGLPPLF